MSEKQKQQKQTMYRAKVWKTGTGYVISVPKIVREAMGLKPGDEVTVIIICNRS